MYCYRTVMMTKFKIYMIVLYYFFGATNCVNILYFSTTASPSHNIWDKTLATALKDRGHVITYVSHTEEKSSKNFSTIHIEGIYEKIYKEFDIMGIINVTLLNNIKMISEWVKTTCQHDLHTIGYKKVLELAEKRVEFDLIIMDIISAPCFYPFIELFGYPPTIATSPFGIGPLVADAFGINLDSSEIPHFAYGVFPPLTFFERMINYFINLYDLKMKSKNWNVIKNMMSDLYGRDMDHIFDIERNFSILLPNYDPVFDFPRSLPPNIIPVGGLHCKRASSLPEDLKKYLDNSKEGVILFSLGTNIRSDLLEESKKNVILETFSKLKQNIIWKFESDIENLPKNVIVRKFLPQNDILAHNNVKLVINHGGALSTQEAMYHGRPIICIPFFIDQFSIAHKVIHRKIGLILNYENLTVDYMLSTINEVINNPIYLSNAQVISKHFKDRPEGPLDRAVFWVEHVIRNGGADHLKIDTKKPFFQINLLDVWAFVLTILIVVILIVYKIIFYFLALNSHKKKRKVQ